LSVGEERTERASHRGWFGVDRNVISKLERGQRHLDAREERFLELELDLRKGQLGEGLAVPGEAVEVVGATARATATAEQLARLLKRD
jgi:hypothetical protein